MYRRPKFLELLLEIREKMAGEAEYDFDQFIQNLRSHQNDASPSTASTRKQRGSGRAARGARKA